MFSIVNGALLKGLPFESLGAFTSLPVNLAEEGAAPGRLLGSGFSSEMLAVLNVKPILGPGFMEGVGVSVKRVTERFMDAEIYAADTDYPLAREGIVTPGNFKTYHTEVLKGRAFTVQDRDRNQPVAVVNRSSSDSSCEKVSSSSGSGWRSGLDSLWWL